MGLRFHFNPAELKFSIITGAGSSYMKGVSTTAVSYLPLSLHACAL